MFRNLYRTLEDFRRFMLRPLILRFMSTDTLPVRAEVPEPSVPVLPQPLFALTRSSKRSLPN